ncbi:MAG: ArsR/SmtB family transcription factor [Acutalibacteraceae bacterium]
MFVPSQERKTALIFKAFCDENRIRILKMLRSGEKCACKLLEELDVTQPTLSHHMKILCDSGVVVGRKEGKWMHYSISAKGAKEAADRLKELTSLEWAEDSAPCCEK